MKRRPGSPLEIDSAKNRFSLNTRPLQLVCFVIAPVAQTLQDVDLDITPLVSVHNTSSAAKSQRIKKSSQLFIVQILRKHYFTLAIQRNWASYLLKIVPVYGTDVDSFHEPVISLSTIRRYLELS
jgi:hypothetical protein